MYWNGELLNAAGDGDLAKVKQCIKNGADINIKDEQFGQTALKLASNMQYMKVIKNMTDDDMNLNTKHKKHSNDDKIALLVALDNADFESIESLIGDFDSNDSSNKGGATALMLASWGGHFSVVKYLIENGANLEAKNDDGETALMWAVSWKRLRIVRLLVNHGASINTTNNNGETALMIASNGGDLDIVRFLVAQGAEIESKNSEGWNAIMFASAHGHLDIVKFLIENGANTATKDKYGKNVLYWARNDELKEFLTNTEANQQNKDDDSLIANLQEENLL